MQTTFLVYSDETGIFTKRYQGIGTVSGEKTILKNLQIKLRNILNDKKINEIGFNDIGTYLPKIEAARLFIENCVDYAIQKKIKVDILV